MKVHETVVLKNDLAELRRLAEKVAEWGSEGGWPEAVVFDLRLATEEIVSNVIRHGYDDEGEHEIVVRAEEEGGGVTVRVEDDGRPFNPLEAPPAPVDRPLEEREIGGLGIHLVLSVMDEVRYACENGRNILTMKKRLEK